MDREYKKEFHISFIEIKRRNTHTQYLTFTTSHISPIAYTFHTLLFLHIITLVCELYEKWPIGDILFERAIFKIY